MYMLCRFPFNFVIYLYIITCLLLSMNESKFHVVIFFQALKSKMYLMST